MVWNPQWTLSNLPQGALHGRRTATMQERGVWTTDAQAQQVAKECCFITGPFSLPRLAVMMTANPNLIFAPYLKGAVEPVAGVPAGMPEAWFGHRKDGTRAQQTGKYINYIMESGFNPQAQATATVRGRLSGVNHTASSWAEWHVRESIRKLDDTNALSVQNGKHPWRGLWFDSLGTFSPDNAPGFWTGTNPGWDPSRLAPYTKTNWLRQAHHIGDVARNQIAGLTNINPERLLICANGLRGVGGGASASVAIAQHFDLVMTEGWLINGVGSTIQTQAAFESNLQVMLDCQMINGKIAEPIENGTSAMTATQQTQHRRFTAGCNLIVSRGLITFEYGDDQGTPAAAETAKDPDLYGTTHAGGSTLPMDLGAPLGGQSPSLASGHRVAVGASNGQASADGLYARLFDGGTVLVNRTNATINYKASKSYTRVPSLQSPAATTYVAGNLIPVPAGSAEFLTTTGGTGGTAPADTRLPELLGTAREGQKLRIRQGAYSGSPTPIITDQIQQSANGTTGWTNIVGEIGPIFTIPFGSGGTPTTYAADDFSDAQTDTWASADTGGAWTVEQGAAADFDKVSGRGTISHGAASSAKSATLNIGQADVDAVVSVSFPAAAAGGNMQGSLMVRWADTSNYLRLNAILAATGGHITINPDKVVAGTSTSLGTAKDLGVYSAGTDVKMRIRTEGNNIKGKAWLASGSEPGAWDWDITDSSITAAGKLGLRSFRGASNTNTSPQTRFDNLTATSLVGTVTGLVGQFLRTHESATNSAGTDTADSAALGAIVAGAPTDPIWDPNAFPSISGTPAEGATLTATPGTVTATPAASIAYQWETSATTNPGSASDIAGETASTHVPASGTAGTYRRVRVTATSGAVSTQQWSDWIGPLVATDVAPSFSANPAITGTTEAGQTLTATLGTPAGSPTPTVGTPQWQRSTNGGATYQDIAGENGTTYLQQLGDQGALIRIQVPLSNRAGDFIGSSAGVGPVTLPTTLPPLTLSVAVE